ncbi:phosphoenolpyruvate carboxylase [Pelagibaculum spongiae]|uniref:Phosphoenolpyruvate carboxylase n=2 Tax=Pelagibaculum spongiae TaxID=2080658 RepID=A0A2V1H132_9GAMM|nr:phosphoenolpyruvate carboxylase [Pelagibaculum spongiae]
MLGDTIRHQAGDAVFHKIEAIRNLAKHARSRDDDQPLGGQGLAEILKNLPEDELLPVARAFSQFLNYANIAEQAHRVRRRRSYRQKAGTPPQDGSLDELVPRLLKAGIAPEQVVKTLVEMRVELVLTAHPTEVTRRTLIRKYQEIGNILLELDRTDLTISERSNKTDRLRRRIIACWETDEIRRQKPTPQDEASWGHTSIEQDLWKTLPDFMRELDRVLQRYTGQRLPLTAAPICFASWMGGDRDGNPNVTHRVTEEVLAMARWKSADLLITDIQELRMDLSMNLCSPELRERAGSHGEPYRQFLRGVRDRLEKTRDWAASKMMGEVGDAQGIYLDDQSLLDDLMLCYNSLVSCGMKSVAEGSLTDLIRRVACFGLALMKLDIRQESTRHAMALDEITQHIGLGSYLEWDEDQKLEFLLRELQFNRPLIDRNFPASPLTQEVLDTLALIADQPANALGAYVISMATSASDVLAVRLLQKIMGVQQPMRVVPLFETLDDLRGAPATIQQLLNIPYYKDDIQGEMEVMIGYSDSAKDASFLTASWAQYQTQEALIKICKDESVHLTLFHGRGGSVSRGGASAHAALLSQPPGSVNGSIRVTEQGEMIQFKFGMPGIAQRSLELYAAATLEATLLPPAAPKAEWREMMDLMAGESVAAYRKVIREQPEFVPYFRALTPEQELQRLSLGSRPAKRKADGGVESLRAIPWVFAWTQVRLMLTAWLGADKALQAAVDQKGVEPLRDMLQNWHYFKSFAGMLEMVLAKAEPAIVSYYEQQLVPAELQPLGSQLRADLQHCKQVLAEITGKDILQGNPVLKRSIDVRNPYVDPLHLLQAELMARCRAISCESTEVEQAMLVTIAGIAAGMRNTG